MPAKAALHIGLVVHDNKRGELLEWAHFNRGTLSANHLQATGTTGTMLEYELGLKVDRFLSGPVGGDRKIGVQITEGGIHTFFFFWDPLEAQPHDRAVPDLGDRDWATLRESH